MVSHSSRVSGLQLPDSAKRPTQTEDRGHCDEATPPHNEWRETLAIRMLDFDELKCSACFAPRLLFVYADAVPQSELLALVALRTTTHADKTPDVVRHNSRTVHAAANQQHRASPIQQSRTQTILWPPPDG